MFNDADVEALARALKTLGAHPSVAELRADELAAALDAAGITGLIHSDEPKESEGNQTFFVRVTVEMEIRAQDPEQAFEWANEHTVFDYLDRGAEVGEVSIHDMNGEDVTP